jgi:putative peptidoglycan binding protein/transglycosylase-like protein with SLT domain
MRRLLFIGFAVPSLWLAPAATAGVDPQVAGLQVALRAFGVYTGPIDAIAGPGTKRGVIRFQRRAGLPADGKVGPATRRAFGPLGGPLFGRRTLRLGLFGWDVSVLQFMLARRGELVPISGYFDARTRRALQIFQRARRLAADGVAGSRTLAAFRRPVPTAKKPVLVSAKSTTPATQVRSLLDYWSGRYGVDGKLVRALAWMESGYQTNLTSSAGAWGVMQILPVTWDYVETVLIGAKVPRTASGNIRVGVVFLRQLLREFGGDERKALAAWYQGPAAVRSRGILPESKVFVANVLALKSSKL